MRKAQAGFTLIELVIVIIIVAILAAASVPIYRNYVRRAVTSEGQALVGTVLAAARTYFVEHQAPMNVPVDQASGVALLGVDTASNRYFRNWSCTLVRAAAAPFAWSVTNGTTACSDPDYTGLSITFSQAEGAAPIVTVVGG